MVRFLTYSLLIALALSLPGYADETGPASITGKGKQKCVLFAGIEGKAYDEITHLTVSPDKAHFAYIGILKSKGQECLDIVLDGRVTTYDKHASAVIEGFSPDSRRFAYTYRYSDIFALGDSPADEHLVVDGKEIIRCDVLLFFSFSADSSHFACVCFFPTQPNKKLAKGSAPVQRMLTIYDGQFIGEINPKSETAARKYEWDSTAMRATIQELLSHPQAPVDAARLLVPKPGPRVASIDGKKDKDYGGLISEIAPGKHTMRVGYNENTTFRSIRSKSDVDVQFDAKPGGLYVVECRTVGAAKARLLGGKVGTIEFSVADVRNPDPAGLLIPPGEVAPK